MPSATTAIVTISDSTSQGTRVDVGGPTVEMYMVNKGYSIVHTEIIPDERVVIERTLLTIARRHSPQILITTGGTGIGPRDVTPEATRAVIDRELPGMAEAMRMESLKHTPFAMISRQVVGTIGKTLIVNLPGSPKATTQCLDVIFPVFSHVTKLLAGHTTHDEETPT